MKHRRNKLWLASALVLALLPAARPAAGQTEPIPLDTIPQAPPSQNGTLPNGVAFEVNCGEWQSDPSYLDAWFFSITGINPCPTVTWAFNQPVGLRFGITNIQVSPDEGVQLQPGTVAEFIHPNHSWNPDTLILQNTSSTTQPDESIFTHPGADEMVVVPVGASTAQRGISFIEVTAFQPGIAVEKTGDGPDPLNVGDTIEYSFLVTNTGETELTGIEIDDPLPGMSPIECPGDTLAPGEDMSCNATYTVTQEDADLGFVENTATVSGQPPGDVPPVTGEGSTTVPPDQTPGISIEKSASGPEPLEVGATIDYSFLVTNTGNVSLSDITVTDPLDGLSPIDCPDDTLAPGAEMTCTATYTVTQEDVDAGAIENTATVTGTPPGDLTPPTNEGTTTFPPDQNPGISMEKAGSGPDPLVVGATIDYSFVVTNTGNVTLTNVEVTDPLPGLSPIDCPDTTLAPGAEMTCTATYEVTQADVDAGVVENTATVTGETPIGGPPPTDESTTTVPPAEPVPALPPLAFVLLLALLATATLWTLRRARA